MELREPDTTAKAINMDYNIFLLPLDMQTEVNNPEQSGTANQDLRLICRPSVFSSNCHKDTHSAIQRIL